MERVLPSRLRARVGGLKSVITPVPLEATGPQVDPDVLTAVAAACRARERLRFSYQSHDGAASNREAEPYHLVNWGRRWYLVAYDVGRYSPPDLPGELAGARPAAEKHAFTLA